MIVYYRLETGGDLSDFFQAKWNKEASETSNTVAAPVVGASEFGTAKP